MTAASIELQLLPQTAGFGPLRCSFIVTAQPSTTQTLRALNPACNQPTLALCTGVLAAFHLEGFPGGVWPQGRIPRGAQLPGFHTHAAQEADEHQPLLQYRRPGAWPAASSSAAPRQMTRVQVCMGHSTGHSTAQHSTAQHTAATHTHPWARSTWVHSSCLHPMNLGYGTHNAQCSSSHAGKSGEGGVQHRITSRIALSQHRFMHRLDSGSALALTLVPPAPHCVFRWFAACVRGGCLRRVTHDALRL